MKLIIAEGHLYSPAQVKILKEYARKEITIQQLPEIARRVPITIVAAQSDDRTLAVDHPEAW